jgi:hypothetical protein
LKVQAVKLFFKMFLMSQAWWHIPVIPVLKRLRQEDHEFETSLSYTDRLCLKNK